MLTGGACADGDGPSVADDTGPTTGTTDVTADTGQSVPMSTGGVDEPTTSSSSTAGSSGSGEETGDTTELEPARGVSISAVHLNPGVAIPIAVDSVAIPPTERSARLPRNRETALRVFLDVDEDVWVERALEARVTVTQEDGTQDLVVQEAVVSSDSLVDEPDSGFLVVLSADLMNAGASCTVELFEAGGDFETLPPVDTPPGAAEGELPLGVEAQPQNMRVVLVPVDYTSSECTTSVDVSGDGLAVYEDALFQLHGLETIEVTAHAPIVVDDIDLSTYDGFVELLGRTGVLRATDQADPNVYYTTLFDNCGACDGATCLGGIGAWAGPTMGDGATRVAVVSTSFKQADSVVHEIGHNQGRSHVGCPSFNQDVDPSYPYADGLIGGWGWGVRDHQVRAAAEHYDYMTYCDAEWVSDWQWNATFERISILSSWDAADMTDALDGSNVLVGLVDTETGVSHWWTDRGWVDPSALDDFTSLRYVDERGDATETAVDVVPLHGGSAVMVRAPLLVAEELERVELNLATVSLDVARAQIRMTR